MIGWLLVITVLVVFGWCEISHLRARVKELLIENESLVAQAVQERATYEDAFAQERKRAEEVSDTALQERKRAEEVSDTAPRAEYDHSLVLEKIADLEKQLRVVKRKKLRARHD